MSPIISGQTSNFLIKKRGTSPASPTGLVSPIQPIPDHTYIKKGFPPKTRVVGF